MKLVSKHNFNILTTEENFEGQRFAILAMFCLHQPSGDRGHHQWGVPGGLCPGHGDGGP